MKGIIFNLLEEAVVAEFGADTWEDLLDDTGLDGAYTSLGSYNDAEIAALITAASHRLNLSQSDVLQWFGQRAMPLLKLRYGPLFNGHPDARNFILSVNKIIHPEVRKLYAGAECPFFHFKEEPDGALILRYRSSRNLIDLAHGFILGAADLWDETVNVLRYPENSPNSDTLVVRWVKA